jgi:hypothetical protein
MNRSLYASCIALTALTAALLTVPPAAARDRQTTVSGPNGHSATRDVSRARGDVSSSTTAGNGNTVGSRNVDRSAGAASGTVTGPNGGTSTRDTTRTPNGSTTNVTGPNGQTGSVTVAR